jgi:hypothetical protein
VELGLRLLFGFAELLLLHIPIVGSDCAVVEDAGFELVEALSDSSDFLLLLFTFDFQLLLLDLLLC